MAAEIAGGRHREVSIALVPSGEGGTFRVTLDGEEIFNRKSLPKEERAPDPGLLKDLGGELRGQLLAALDKTPVAT